MKTLIAIQLIQCQIAIVSLAIEQREYKRDLGGRFSRVKDSVVESVQEAIAQVGEFFLNLTKGKNPDPKEVQEVFEYESERLSAALSDELGKKTRNASKIVSKAVQKESINDDIFTGLINQAKGMIGSLTKEGVENGICLTLAVGVYGAAILQSSGAMDSVVKDLMPNKDNAIATAEDAFNSVSPVALAIGISTAFVDIKKSGVVGEMIDSTLHSIDKASAKLGEDEKFIKKFKEKTLSKK